MKFIIEIENVNMFEARRVLTALRLPALKTVAHAADVFKRGEDVPHVILRLPEMEDAKRDAERCKAAAHITEVWDVEEYVLERLSEFSDEEVLMMLRDEISEDANDVYFAWRWDVASQRYIIVRRQYGDGLVV